MNQAGAGDPAGSPGNLFDSLNSNAGSSSGSSSRSRPPTAPRIAQYPVASPLLPSTITFIASWKGQLLVCIVSLALGAVYFIIRDPIRAWSRRRKERLSRARAEELMSMEASEAAQKESAGKDKDGDKGKEGEEEGKEKRGRDRRKKRGSGGNLLRTPTAITANDGSSSVDGSPLPTSSTSSSPMPSRRRVSSTASPLPSVLEGRRISQSSSSAAIRRKTTTCNPLAHHLSNHARLTHGHPSARLAYCRPISRKPIQSPGSDITSIGRRYFRVVQLSIPCHVH